MFIWGTHAGGWREHESVCPGHTALSETSQSTCLTEAEVKLYIQGRGQMSNRISQCKSNPIKPLE